MVNFWNSFKTWCCLHQTFKNGVDIFSSILHKWWAVVLVQIQCKGWISFAELLGATFVLFLLNTVFYLDGVKFENHSWQFYVSKAVTSTVYIRTLIRYSWQFYVSKALTSTVDIRTLIRYSWTKHKSHFYNIYYFVYIVLSSSKMQ